MISHHYCYLSKGSSRPEVFCKKGVFRNFAKFTGKNLYQSHLFFNKVAGHYSKNTFSYRIPRMAASEVKHLSKQEHNAREMRAAKRVTIFHSKTKLVH